MMKRQQKTALNSVTKEGKAMNVNTDLKINVEYVIKKDLMPCVVFAFSRKKCFELASGMCGVDVCSKSEKSEIKTFFRKSIARLSEEDRALMQIKQVESILLTGIGYHHAGLIPILKEIIEILFSRGLIKILFATTTFAMGLNMPARSVMFSNLRKYDGKNHVYLQPSEYLQMAGRAGRRGKDKKGSVLIYFDRGELWKYNHIENDLDQMMNKNAESLQSKFRLTYKIILFSLNNQQSNETLASGKQVQISDLMRSSFSENETENMKLNCVERARELRSLLSSAKDIDCFKGVPESIEDYGRNLKKLRKVNSKIIHSLPTQKILGPRVLIEFTFNAFENVIGLITQNNGHSLLVLTTELERLQNSRIGIRYEEKSQGQDYQYVSVKFQDVQKIFETEVKAEFSVNPDGQLKFKSRNQIVEELIGLSKKPLRESRLKKELKDVLSEVEEKEILNVQIQSSECRNCEYFDQHSKQTFQKSAYETELQTLTQQYDSSQLIKFNEYISKSNVLRQMNFIDENGVVQLKGRFCREIYSADSVILTNFIFDGGLKDLNESEACAILALCLTKAGGSCEPDEDSHQEIESEDF